MSRSLVRRLIRVAAIAFPATPLAAQAPPARRSAQVDVFHGDSVADPYRWMENMVSPETRRWIAAQDTVARRFAAGWPARDSVRALIAGVARSPVIKITPTVKEGGRYFYSRFKNTGPNLAFSETMMRTSPVAEPVVVLDGDGLFRAGRAVRRVLIAPDGRHLLYGTSEQGSEWEVVRIRDVESGQDLPDELTGFHRVSGVVWARRGPVGFYYSRLALPDASDQLKARLEAGAVYFHRLGTSQARDELVYERTDHPEWYFTPQVSDDGRHLLITAAGGSEINGRIFYKNLLASDAQVVPLIPEGDARFRFIGNAGNTVWFETSLNAPNGRVVALDVTRPVRANWTDVIPESKDPFDTWRGGVFAVGGHLVALYRVNARLEARVFDLNGAARYTLELPYRFPSVWSGIVGHDFDPEAFLVVQGLADQGTVYRLDVGTGKLSVFERPSTSYDLDALVTEQVMVTSKDGTPVPMVVIRRRDTKLDGIAPGLIYGYGANGWIASPWFQPGIAEWVALGGVWALPGLRGGGEYGIPWIEAGRRRNKQNAIDDYIAAAEYLVANRYVAPKKMVANASSMGGVIAAAAIVQRPDLFGASILDYPAIDMLRYDQFTAGQRWEDEYGSPKDSADYAVLRRYSPIHHVRAGVCYPPTLIAPGENDQTAAPMHAYKFAATLQYANSRSVGCDSPVVLRVSWGAGHSSGKSVVDSVDNWADQIAFLARVLELPWLAPRARRGGESH